MQSQARDRTIADGCALHDGAAFVAICRGCGAYMCARCNADGQYANCEQCRAAQATAHAFPHAAARERPSALRWGELLRFTWAVYTQNFGLVTAAVVLAGLPMLLMQTFSGAPLLLLGVFGVGETASDQAQSDQVVLTFLWLLQFYVSSVLTVGTLDIALCLMRGQPARLSMLWTGYKRAPGLMLQSALLFAITALMLSSTAAPIVALFVYELFTVELVLAAIAASLLLLAGAGYVLVRFILSGIEYVGQPELSALAAMRNAWDIAAGRQIALSVGLLLILGLMTAGFLACFVGLVFTLGYAGLLYAGMYLVMRDGAQLPVTNDATTRR